VIHVTDGESTDGNPEDAANLYRTLGTQDGDALLFNCHLSKLQAMGVLFPLSEAELPADPYAHLLFRMSSVLPESLRRGAEIRQINCSPGAHGMAFNADGAAMIALIQAGTVPEKIDAPAFTADEQADQGIGGFEQVEDAPVGYEGEDSEQRPDHLV
jgi:hypothetical protein